MSVMAKEMCTETEAPRVHTQRDSRQPKKSLVRTLRTVLDTVVPFLGVVLILSTVLLVRELRLQIALVAVLRVLGPGKCRVATPSL